MLTENGKKTVKKQKQLTIIGKQKTFVQLRLTAESFLLSLLSMAEIITEGNLLYLTSCRTLPAFCHFSSVSVDLGTYIMTS